MQPCILECRESDNRALLSINPAKEQLARRESHVAARRQAVAAGMTGAPKALPFSSTKKFAMVTVTGDVPLAVEKRAAGVAG
jgi:hypothetical protein